jgi:hypothetical protein
MAAHLRLEVGPNRQSPSASSGILDPRCCRLIGCGGSAVADEVREKRRQMKMAALIDLYEAEGCVIQRGKRQGEAMKPRTKAYTMARLRHHVLPLLGQMRVPAINAGDIERFVADVTAGKTASDQIMGPRRRIVVRGGAGAARKVRPS